MLSAVWRIGPAGCRGSGRIMARPCRPCSAMDDPLASRCIDAALVLSESAARADFRGPDPFDGLWWHWPKAVVGGRRRRQAVVQAARASAGRRAAALPPPPPGDRQGARRLRLGRGARASPLAGRAGRGPPDAARCDLLDADRSAGAARMGLPRGTSRRAGASTRRAAPTSSRRRSRRAACSKAARLTGRAQTSSSAARAAARWAARRALGRSPRATSPITPAAP